MTLRALGAAAALGALGYKLTVEGSLTLDTGWGRTTRPLGCPPVLVAAGREVLFDVLCSPYAAPQSRAMAAKVAVLERGTDMVLAAHRTPVRPGLVATTVETVRFQRPERIDFRLVRGPVAAVSESFVLYDDAGATRVEYSGEMGADLWALGRWWSARVAAVWEAAVIASLDLAKTEAERRSNPPR